MVFSSTAADTARIWRGEPRGPVPVGSDAHKALFCRMLLETFNPYRPAAMDWPKLSEAERRRLIELPIWDMAVQTEGRARLNVATYAEGIEDPLLKQAIELNGFEEGRHKEVLANMVAAYGIALPAEPRYARPRSPEWAFMRTGFSECIDSFFAFGLFEVAKRSGYFPQELVDTFEPVMQEECRHILFFSNWVAWHRKNLPWWRKPLFLAKTLAVWACLIWERIGTARGMGGPKEEESNFTVTGTRSVGVDLDARELLDICLAENERRFSGYDARLLRPRLVPRLAALARRLMGKPRPKSPVAIGSTAHRDLFCRDFIATYQDYDPETLPWPELDEAALTRLRAVPFWEEVLHTELRAGAIVKAFTETIDDPVLKDAVALQGFEESRHADLIRVMIRRYGIDVTEHPLAPLPADIETAFKDFGFGECVDSFLGFGVFKIAQQSGFLPDSMFAIFDRLMYEETRHIVFFVNWMAYRQAQRGRLGRLMRPFAALRYYARAFRRVIATARRGADANGGKDFTATQAGVFLDGFTFRRFLEDCYSENARRMSTFDLGLLRPGFLPALADVALASLRLWSIRSASDRTRR